jgi:tRNA modification GTPase
LVLWFPAPGSFTGEDLAELHLHGGRAVVQGVLTALAEVEGLRPAEPGEFTRRGFNNGKFDLTMAEAMADLVAADTAAQRRQALRQMDGALGRLYQEWRNRLISCCALVEAEIDFSDQDLPEGVAAGVRMEMRRLAGEIEAHLADGHRGERLRAGVTVAVVGAPNVGKSSLINQLARREVAIVSEWAGTTRDVIEVHLDLGGVPVILADTAGLRTGADELEREGIRRALRRAEESEFCLAVFDATEPTLFDPAILEQAGVAPMVVVNKIDLRPDLVPMVAEAGAVAVSARNGVGIPALIARLTDRVAGAFAGGELMLTRPRHRVALEACRDHLERGRGVDLPELLAEDLRLAARWLGRITGEIDVEDVLDQIFRDFCIGK